MFGLSFSEILVLIIGLLSIVGFIIDRIIRPPKTKSLVDRVTTLEECQTKISEDITKIKDNHLAHIQNDITTLKLVITKIATNLGIDINLENK